MSIGLVLRQKFPTNLIDFEHVIPLTLNFAVGPVGHAATKRYRSLYLLDSQYAIVSHARLRAIVDRLAVDSFSKNFVSDFALAVRRS